MKTQNSIKINLIHNPSNAHSEIARAQQARIGNKIRAIQYMVKPNNFSNRQQILLLCSEKKITIKPASVTLFDAQIELSSTPYTIPQEDVKDKINCLYKVINKKQKIFKYVSKRLDKSINKPHLIKLDTHLINNVMNAILDKETGKLPEYR